MATKKIDLRPLLKMGWKDARDFLEKLEATSRNRLALGRELIKALPDSDGDATDLMLRSIQSLTESEWIPVAEAAVRHRSIVGALRAIRMLDESGEAAAREALKRIDPAGLHEEVLARLMKCAAVKKQAAPKVTELAATLEVPSGKLTMFDLLEPFTEEAGSPWTVASKKARLFKQGKDVGLIFVDGAMKEDAPLMLSIEHIGPVLADQKIFQAIEKGHQDLYEACSELSGTNTVIPTSEIGLKKPTGQLLVWDEFLQQQFTVHVGRDAKGKVGSIWIREKKRA